MKRFLASLLTGTLILSNTLTSFAMQPEGALTMEIPYEIEVDEHDNSIEKEVYDEVEEEGPSASDVFAKVGSSFTVAIPKIIVLSGQEKKADYYVAVKGDFAGTEYIQVVTEPSFWLYDVSGVKDPEKAFNERPKQLFVSTNLETAPEDAVNGVNPDEYTKSFGKITAPTITAGKWHSQVNFYVGLFDDFTDIVPVASDGTILELSAESLNIGEEFIGYKDSEVILSEALSTNLLQNSDVEDLLKEEIEKVAGDTVVEPTNTEDILENIYENAVEAKEKKEIFYETDSDVVKVTSDGRVYLDGAKAGDTATITATYKGVANSEVPGVNDRDDISVSFDVTVYRVDVSKKEVHLDLGDTTSLTAEIYPSYVEEDIQWKLPEMMDGVTFTSSTNTESNITTMTIDVAEDAIDDNNGQLTAYVPDETTDSSRIVINAKHKHNYVLAAQGDATCEEKGYKTYVCNGCDESTEGHTYTDYEPELGHVCSDGHWCDRCDKLVYPYRTGETIRKTVAGQELEFVCVSEDYTSQNGQKGAYFMSVGLLKNVRYDNSSGVWATSSLRSTLNASNSDKKHVTLTNTTVKTSKKYDIVPQGTYFGFEMFEPQAYNGAETYDYYFAPSMEEVVAHVQYLWDPYGEGDSNYYMRNGSLFGFWLRTPTFNKTTPEVTFAYTDARMITSNPAPTWLTTLTHGARVAFMVEQDVKDKTVASTWKVGDVTYREINGRMVKFTCADSNYRDASRQDIGALFIAEEIFGSTDTVFDTESNVWATSDLREYMNTHFDTTGLVKVNTTTDHAIIKDGNASWVPLGERYKPYDPKWATYEQWAQGNYLDTDDIVSPDTYDYYFVLSAEEACAYSPFMLSSNGQRKDLSEQWAEDRYGVALRSANLDSTTTLNYILTDAKYYNVFADKNVNDTTIGYRPCFVLPHEK